MLTSFWTEGVNGHASICPRACPGVASSPLFVLPFISVIPWTRKQKEFGELGYPCGKKHLAHDYLCSVAVAVVGFPPSPLTPIGLVCICRGVFAQ